MSEPKRMPFARISQMREFAERTRDHDVLECLDHIAALEAEHTDTCIDMMGQITSIGNEYLIDVQELRAEVEKLEKALSANVGS